MDNKNGIFTISLDFELYWGMRDVISIEGYKAHLEKTPKAIEDMLELFKNYDIHTTWATVGFLFCKNIKEVKENYPDKLPKYKDDDINLYSYIEQNPKLENRYHFAPKSIDLIRTYPNQEIATHTFSHYYCLEDGQDEETFFEDLKIAKNIATKKGISLNSIVFPRNQYSKKYLLMVKNSGITSYRGNEKGWIYDAVSEDEKKTPTKRLLRLIDSYINISGYHTYKLKHIAKETPYNIPASRFLRPYCAKISFLESLRLNRIKKAMTYAACNGEIFHLWWHPHNFGIDTKENIAFLASILKHYKMLKREFGMRSLTMDEISNQLFDSH